MEKKHSKRDAFKRGQTCKRRKVQGNPYLMGSENWTSFEMGAGRDPKKK